VSGRSRLPHPRRRRGAATATPRGLRWAIYLRNSKQRRVNGVPVGYSIPTQALECRAFVAHLDPDAASVEEIVDRGRPGGAGVYRPGMEQVLELVKAGAVDAVMAFKADRIGRSLRESEAFWDDCERAGAWVAACDAPDLSDPAIRGMLFGMAERENQSRSDWAHTSLQRRREAGLPPVKSAAAYGMRWDGDELALEPAEWAVVARVFQAFDAGSTINEIARSLSADRVPRRRSRRHEWNAAAVSRILHCSWYIGLVPDNDAFWNARFNPLAALDGELWDRVQARLGDRRRTGQNLNHVMSGLLFCGLCGGPSPMSVLHEKKVRKDGSVLRTPRYRCIHHVNDRTACPGQSISGTHVERFLLEQIRAVIDGDELSAARFARRQITASQGLEHAAARHDAAVADLRAQRERLISRVKDEGFAMDAVSFNAQLQSLQQQITLHETHCTQALGRASLSRAALARLRNQLDSDSPLSLESWGRVAPARRNEFLRAMFPAGLLVHPAPPDTPRGQVQSRLTIRARSPKDASKSP